MLTEITEMIKTHGIRLLYGILSMVVGLFLARWALRFLANGLEKSKADPTLKVFLKNVLQILLYSLVVLTAVAVLGVPLTSFITLLASAGVAISLAMQGALSNLVGGVTLLLLKPIRIGEYIKIGDQDGTVRNIGTFYTDLVTPDNRRISIPNSNMVNVPIVNFTREGTRRMDLSYSVSYEADMGKVRSVLLSVAESCSTVLQDPSPLLLLTECGDSGLNCTLRLWCRSSDFIATQALVLEKGKEALDRAGISIPYPQMDIHIKDMPREVNP